MAPHVSKYIFYWRETQPYRKPFCYTTLLSSKQQQLCWRVNLTWGCLMIQSQSMFKQFECCLERQDIDFNSLIKIISLWWFWQMDARTVQDQIDPLSSSHEPLIFLCVCVRKIWNFFHKNYVKTFKYYIDKLETFEANTKIWDEKQKYWK